jgi:hypothetical protein
LQRYSLKSRFTDLALKPARRFPRRRGLVRLARGQRAGRVDDLRSQQVSIELPDVFPESSIDSTPDAQAKMENQRGPLDAELSARRVRRTRCGRLGAGKLPQQR